MQERCQDITQALCELPGMLTSRFTRRESCKAEWVLLPFSSILVLHLGSEWVPWISSCCSLQLTSFMRQFCQWIRQVHIMSSKMISKMKNLTLRSRSSCSMNTTSATGPLHLIHSASWEDEHHFHQPCRCGQLLRTGWFCRTVQTSEAALVTNELEDCLKLALQDFSEWDSLEW